jgi:hypothetical protein
MSDLQTPAAHAQHHADAWRRGAVGNYMCCHGLRIVEPLMPLRPVTVTMYWHSRTNDDAAHR